MTGLEKLDRVLQDLNHQIRAQHAADRRAIETRLLLDEDADVDEIDQQLDTLRALQDESRIAGLAHIRQELLKETRR